LLYSVIVKNVKSSFDLLDTKEYQKPSVRDLNFIQLEGKHLSKKDSSLSYLTLLDILLPKVSRKSGK